MDDELLHRLDVIERMLTKLLTATQALPESEWISSEDFATLAGLGNTKQVNYLISKGVFDLKCMRNVGTEKRPRYRFHRTKALDQFLNRANRVTPR